MNTNDLASHVAAQTSATKATAEHMVGAVFSAISDALARDEPRPGAMAVSGSTATDCRSPFLTGTRGRDFFDMWNVRTCPFHGSDTGVRNTYGTFLESPQCWGCPTSRNRRTFRVSHQYRRKRTRRELPSGRKAPLVWAPSERRTGDPSISST